MKKKKSEQTKCSNQFPNYCKLQEKIVKREADEDSNMSNAEGEANKEKSKRLTAEWMWNWPRTSVEDVGWQDFRSESLFVVTTQVLEDAIHLVMSERLVMRTEENLNLI